MGSLPAVALWAVLGQLCAHGALAAPQTVVSLTDARGDDHGPGSYQYPSNPQNYPAGALDLRAFDVQVDGDDVIFRVTLGASVRRSAIPVRRQIGSTEIALENAITAQNLDIYIDTHAGRGFTETLPGRNVRVRADDAWDVAVVFTPQPEVTRSLMRDWGPAPHVVFPGDVRASGTTFEARVPRSVLGGAPERHWGYTVLVTAAVWETSFSLMDRALGGRVLNAFTMPVAPVPENLVIGGAPLSAYAPAVMDLPVPPGTTQHAVLKTTEDATAFVEVPLVYPHGVRPPASVRAAEAPVPDAGPSLDAILAPRFSASVNVAPLELVVADVSGDLVILTLPAGSSAPTPHRVGLVLDDSDTVQGRVVVMAVRESFVTATIIDGKGAVRKGRRVQFAVSPPDAR